MDQSPLGPSFSVSPAGSCAPSAIFKGNGIEVSLEPVPHFVVKTGWQVARELADWMAGQERKAAIKYIDRMEEIYNADRTTEAPGESQTLPVSSGNRGLEESAERQSG